ncbi:hybrid sensor histidine kinase/response regulator [Romeriopsis navalis]|nr:ATP-binding protein [Romeriopsis navalis]
MESLATANILIVEDEKIVAWDIQERLEKLGYQIAGRTASAKAAIAAAAETPPDLVLMDIQIEGTINGIETAKILYDQFKIPVIYLTAHSDDQTLAAATQTNPFGYLLKPFQTRELHSTIQIALQRYAKERQANLIQPGVANTLNCLDAATIVTNISGRVTFINQMAERLTGWSREQALGMSINQLLSMVDMTTHAPIIQPDLTLETWGNPTEPYRLNSNSGKEILVKQSTSSICNAAGAMIGYVIVLHDITQQITEQAALQQHNQDLEAFQIQLIAQLSEKTAQFDLAIAYMQILVQLLAPKSLTQSPKDLVQWTLQEFGQVFDLDYAWVALHDECNINSSVIYEYRAANHRPDNWHCQSIVNQVIALSDYPDFYQMLFLGISWCNPDISLLPPSYKMTRHANNQQLISPIFTKQIPGEPPVIMGELGLIASGNSPWSNPLQMQLITQIISYAASISRQSELAAIMQAQKVDLEILNYLKEDFISSVSHSLKVPLENMQQAIGAIEKLLQQFQPIPTVPISRPHELAQTQAKLHNQLNILQKEWQREYDFVKMLLEMNTSARVMEPRHFHQIILQPYFSELLEQFSPQAIRFEQTLSYEIRSEYLIAYSHRSTLTQILKELLNNAIKYTPPQQTIQLSAQNIDDQLELHVTNTGITIPAASLSQIFQPFYRVPRSNPWDYCGTGLGLAFVQKLVMQLGGHIQVESSQKVTRFVVKLPQV